MLANYLLITIRTFFRNKVAFIINLIGMSIALGCCITAWVNYEYNSDFDKQQLNGPNIYRVAFWQQTETKKVPYGVCPLPLGNLLRENLHEGDKVIQYISKDGQFRIGDELFQREFVYADAAFTKIFTLQRLSGDLSLEDKGHVLISDKLARTFFGRTDVVGQPLTQLISGEPREFIVGGIYKEFPGNSSFRFDLLTSYENYFIDPSSRNAAENDWTRWSTTFLYIKDKAIIDALTKQLQSFIKVQNDARPDLKVERFYIEPFERMSYRAVRERNQGHWLRTGMPLAAVVAPFAMAGFLLLVACFNFMNNAIAISGNRLKEIGIRKVVGGKRKELIFQFLAETTFFCLLALAIALVLAEYFTDGWNGMWAGLDIAIRYEENWSFLAVLGALMLVTALLAGGYPAFYISKFRPIHILRGTVRFGGANLLTKGLLVFQFSISLAAVIFALAFYFNSRFQKEYDLGYSWRSVIEVRLDDPKQFDVLKNELSREPLIQSLAGSEHHIYARSYKASAKATNQVEKEVDLLNVGDDYFQTVNVRILGGRSFEKEQASDADEAIIVNEEFIRAFQLGENALGQRITLNDSTNVYIIGIAKDVYLRALFQPLTPVAFRYVMPDQYNYLLVSADPSDLSEANAHIADKWKKLFPSQLYTGRLMETSMNMSLEHFDSVVKLYTFLGLVAIIMSVSGLYSLVSLHLQKRTRELGIRKILGAPLPHIILQSGKLFLVIMLISIVAGSVMGSFMVNALMDSVWEYYVSVNPAVLTLSIAILFIISLTTIGYKVMRVVLANPVDSIKTE